VQLNTLTASKLSELLKKREVSAREAVSDCLEQIQKLNLKLNAFLTVTEKEALKQAEVVDSMLAKSERVGLLAGIPIAVKDNICIKGIRATCGSKILENFVPVYDATVVQKLKAADAVILGKTNLDEFAMGSSTEYSHFGATRNPINPEKIPGGSSGGSACAVASNMAVLALGSDTGGSVRQPAALCGIVGLKPTYGTVSRYGLVAFASSLDQISPFGKDVKDVALLFSVISGHDPHDSTSLNIEPKNYAESLGKSEKKFRVGVPKEAFQAGLERDVAEAFKSSLDTMRKLGWKVEEISLKHLDYSIAAYYIVATAEASSNLARYDGVKYGYRAREYKTLAEMYERTRGDGFGPEVKRRIMLGTYVLSAGYYEAYYGKGQKVRTLIKRDFDEAFKNFDVIVMPTSPTVAFGLGEKIEDPLAMYLSDIFTTVANLAGIPAMSIPMGKSKEGLPIGLQILAPALREDLIFEAAYGLEQSLREK
jgi:aspartyl-tRNA(Asn)/glutamyl-tRNA(Gln) amidotransferase subunit A